MLFIHFILNFLLITSYLLVFISKNPVYSVLFLILSFCNASAILFLFKIEFLALIFIIIYVGAIVVLFLFVVMILNVNEFSTINIFSITFIVFGIFNPAQEGNFASVLENKLNPSSYREKGIYLKGKLITLKELKYK